MQKKSERSELYKIKKHKDLSFLLQIKEEAVSETIKKYILSEGAGKTMAEIKVPITVYYSFQKYDYTGKFFSRTENKSHSFPLNQKSDDIEDNKLGKAVLSMKLNEKCWFNIQLYDKYSTTCSGYPGYHYQITLEKFVYKNDNNFESKRLIYEENREKAKAEFMRKNYKDAIKIYKNSINILKALSKKFFSPDELKILKDFCEKSEENFLKCIAKMHGFGGRYDKEIGKQAKEIADAFMIKNPQSIHSFYKKAIYLKYNCLFTDAEDAIKQAFTKKFSDDPDNAAMEKAALKKMLEEIRNSKERNLRHLHREEIRKKISAKRNADLWEDDQDEDAWE